MKVIRNAFERMRPAFGDDGRLRVLAPVFCALDNFFFAPAGQTTAPPHVRDPLDIKRYMSTVIIALVPATAASVYFFGLRVLALIAVSYTIGGIVEVLFAVVRKEEINEGFLVTGLIFPLVLPPGIPFWIASVGIAFGVIFGKEVFGGTGRNPFNPALVGRCFIAIAYPSHMASSWIQPSPGIFGNALRWLSASTVDSVTGATPLIAAKSGHFTELAALIRGNIAGSCGETSALAVIIGGLFLLLTRIGNWRITVSTLLSAATLQAAISLHGSQSLYPALWHLFAGGLLFGAFFMATDPVTGPSTNGGKWLFGLLTGSVTILIRNFTGYVEGVMFAILLGNIVSPLIDEVCRHVYLKRLAYEE